MKDTYDRIPLINEMLSLAAQADTAIIYSPDSDHDLVHYERGPDGVMSLGVLSAKLGRKRWVLCLVHLDATRNRLFVSQGDRVLDYRTDSVNGLVALAIERWGTDFSHRRRFWKTILKFPPPQGNGQQTYTHLV